MFWLQSRGCAADKGFAPFLRPALRWRVVLQVIARRRGPWATPRCADPASPAPPGTAKRAANLASEAPARAPGPLQKTQACH
jgi:hypothetical protein